MASQAKITIRVTASRGASTVSVSSNGRYVSLNTAGYQRQLLAQPIQPTASLSAFWLAVLASVVADLTANPAPP
jgi:hypothetical protein